MGLMLAIATGLGCAQPTRHGVVGLTVQSPSCATPEEMRLQRCWNEALAPDFWRHCEGCRELVTAGKPALDFLARQLDVLRECHGQRVAVAQGLIDCIIEQQTNATLHELTQHSAPAIRLAAIRELARRDRTPAPAAVAHSQR
jgi:hypothetical protein